MSPRRASFWSRLLLLLILVAVGGILHFCLFLLRPGQPAPDGLVTIAPGSGLGQISRQLEREGVVTSAFYFQLLGRASGAAGRIKAGEYLFAGPVRPTAALDRLVSGDVFRHPFTVPEGLTLREIAVRLEREGLGNREAFVRLATDPKLAADLGIGGETLEGYLFPETYSFPRGMGEERILRAMVAEFRRQVPAELIAEGEKLGLDLHRLVNLASIIQKESGQTEEMPLVAAVFHNRLRLGMPLQADPTVIYGIPDFDGNITRRHLAEKTPYNTYRQRGLPAGPIANPGLAALQAATRPAAEDYLYFVARGDGTHAFSRTLAEHNLAVRRYQLGERP